MLTLRISHNTLLSAAMIVAILGTAVVTALAVAPSPPEPVSGGTAEEMFLDAAYAAAPGLRSFPGATDQRLITIGRQSCDVVRTGGSFAEAESVMMSSGFSADEASTVTYLAEANFCPRIPAR